MDRKEAIQKLLTFSDKHVTIKEYKLDFCSILYAHADGKCIGSAYEFERNSFVTIRYD